MLAIKINGTPIDLSADTSVTLKFLSPLFNTIGDHSYPFKIPATPHNQKIFRWKHKPLNAAYRYEEFPAEMEFNGLLLAAGTMKINKATGKTYETVLMVNRGDFNYLAKNTKLNQVDMGEKVFASEGAAMGYMKETCLGVYPDYEFVMPEFSNPDYFDPATEENELKKYNYQYSNNYTSIFQLVTDESGSKTVLVPMLYLRYVLSKLFPGIGYQLDDGFFSTHADYNRLVLYNQTCANNAGTDREPDGYSPAHLIFNYHVPKVTVSEFLKGLCNLFGIGMFIDNMQRVVRLLPLRDLARTSAYLEWSDGVIDQLQVEYDQRYDGFTLSMGIEDDYMQVLRDTDELTIKNYKGSVKTFGDIPDWPESEIFSVYYVESSDKYYKLDPDLTWSETSGLTLATKTHFRAGGTAIESSMSTVAGENVSGKIDEYGDIIPRVFFVSEPLGGVSADPTPSQETDDHSIGYFFVKFAGGRGDLLENWKDFLAMRCDAREVVFQKRMTAADIRELDLSRKHMVNGIKVLLSEVQVAITMDSLKTASVKAYTCQ